MRSGRRSRKFESCHLDHFGSEKCFSEPFSLTTAMQSLRFDRESGGYISTHRLISIYRFLKVQSYMQTPLLAYQTQGIL